MASSNFQPWDAPKVNIQSDAQYASDAMRTNGAPTGAILPSPLFNKFALQTSVFVAAFGQMLAGKGYSTSDSDQGALSGVLANLLTNADVKPNSITVPYSPTPVFDCSKANGFVISLNGAVTSSTIINYTPGQIITFKIVSTSPGNYPFTWPTNVIGPPDVLTMSQFNILETQFIADASGGIYPMETTINYLLGRMNAADEAIGTKQSNLGFTPVQQGGGSGQGTNHVFIGWDGAGLRAQVDSTDLGEIVFQSILAALISSNAIGNGWLKVAGVLIQWGTTPTINPQHTFTQGFNIPFPTQCFGVIVSCMSNPSNEGRTVYTRSWNTGSFDCGANGNDCQIFWIALGK